VKLFSIGIVIIFSTLNKDTVRVGVVQAGAIVVIVNIHVVLHVSAKRHENVLVAWRGGGGSVEK
jgi:hypothetical protein